MWRILCSVVCRVCCLCCVWLCAWSWLWRVWCPRVYWQDAHMLKHVCACCGQTRGRFESRHGGALDGHTAVFQRATPHNTYRTPNTHTQHHTETQRESERERERQRQRKNSEREGEEKMKEEKEEEREEEKKKNSVLTCTRSGTCRCHCFAHFLKRNRNLEHVRSMICAVQSL